MLAGQKEFAAQRYFRRPFVQVDSRRRGLRFNIGYITAMKTAVSLPDELFRMAEATAHRLRVSRSELYARAIAEFLKGQRDNSITERLNDVYSRRAAKLDSGLHRAQLKSLGKDAW
jgi:hypothetical protein